MVISYQTHCRLFNRGRCAVGGIKCRGDCGGDRHPRILVKARITDHILLTRRFEDIHQRRNNGLESTVDTAHLVGAHSRPIIMCKFIARPAKIGLGRSILLRSIRVDDRFSVIDFTPRVFKILRRIHGTSAIRRSSRTEILARRRLTITLAVHLNRALGFALLCAGRRKPSVGRIHEECVRQMFLHSS